MSRIRLLPAVLGILLLVTGARDIDAQGRATACCTVASVNTASGVATGTVTASGNVFEFTARNRTTLASLRVGQALHVNFANNQVSLDGRAVWGTVTKAPAPPAAAVRPAQPPTTGRPTVPATPNVSVSQLGNLSQVILSGRAPSISFGAPVPHTPNTKQLALAGLSLPPTRFASRTVSATVGGRQIATRPALHLYGLEGIENAPSGLPDGVRRLLEIHARKTPAGQQTHYIVDPEIVREWARTHEVPADVKVKSGGKCKGNEWERFRCRSEKSWDNWSELTSDEWERLREKAQEWWDDAAEVLKQCSTTDGWSDKVVHGPTVPVPISMAPSMTVNMQQSGSRGSATGTLSGSVTLGFPMQGNFNAGVTFFYIPCLPGVYRVRSLTADGGLTVGNQLSVNVTAKGAFDKSYTVPPGGGPQFPLYVIPIVIGDIPVAVIDVSIYIEGDVQVSGDASASGGFSVMNSHRSQFDFDCGANGCKGSHRGSSAPTTTNQSAQIQGQVQVKPGIFTALQLSFDYNILQGRAGPEPYLLGIGSGCGTASATQTAGSSSMQSNHALVADVDWGLMLRAEALAGGQRIGNRWEYNGIMRDTHLWFRDLAPGGSSALMPSLTGPTQLTSAQPAAVKVSMPACYPYSDKVQYRLTWDGGATFTAPANACTWAPGGGSGTCRFDPKKELPLNVTWPSAGAFNLSVQLVEDDHNRRFTPTPSATHRVTVATASGTSP
ncbi:MAG: hypothetical protein AB1762_04205 [Gemmatimonadota bacterium]